MIIMRVLDYFYFCVFPVFLFYKRLKTVKQEYFCYSWVEKHLKWAYKPVNYSDFRNNNIEEDNSIFLYWKQGWINAPSIVKKCLESVKQHAAGHPLVLLDESNIIEYVRMPDFIEQKHKNGLIKEALYSDLLRISLLIKYGGCWIDATCLLSKPIPNDLFNSGFFMFSSTCLSGNYSPIVGSSWFIISSKKRGSILLKKIQNFLFNYYSKKSYPINYYIFHIVLSVLVNKDEECKLIWQEKPYICNMNPHVLQFSLHHIYNEKKYNNIMDQCFIHKLTYKFDHELLSNKSPENMLSHLMSNEQ